MWINNKNYTWWPRINFALRSSPYPRYYVLAHSNEKRKGRVVSDLDVKLIQSHPVDVTSMYI